MGIAWGVAASILFAMLGAWSVYLLVWLYLEFKSRIDLQGKVRPEGYIVQVCVHNYAPALYIIILC